MLRIYQTQPLPTAIHEEDIRRIEVNANFLRCISAKIDLENLAKTRDTAEMQSCLTYQQKLTVDLEVVAQIKGTRASSVKEEVLASSSHDIVDLDGQLLSREFLKDQCGMSSSKRDKLIQYCEKLIGYVSRAEHASVLSPVSQIELASSNPAEQLPSVAVQLAQSSQHSGESKALDAKIQSTVKKIKKMVDRIVEVDVEPDEEGQILQMDEMELLAAEDKVPVLSYQMLKSVMGSD